MLISIATNETANNDGKKKKTDSRKSDKILVIWSVSRIVH